ncbi:ABC transporter permease [Pseudomonas grimontii]|jgi:ABC-2 type transport system permease protein|uniref:ABC transporter permease n=1 Tax=Pseudomonas grimontii TaxID=129847 RepID=UPI002169DE3C|nr:ABC transporter permease [Pseudomonas grimontii]MCS3512581.1 ABC-2 type transport system permease protein [Pseudomonas grimontii]
MSYCFLVKPLLLAQLFIKEQLKEPVALFWIVLSPVVTFYLVSYARLPASDTPGSYLSNTSWFYAFVSSSVAFFGLAFYIVGRRESGFLRSFVYTSHTKIIFLVGQVLAYSFMSLVYCTAFYVSTRNYYGVMGVAEFFVIVGRFYVCFLMFSIMSLLLTLIPLGFQNAHTAFSILSFAMLALGIANLRSSHALLETLSVFNPMWWANHIMLSGVSELKYVVMTIVFLFGWSLWLTFRFLLVNPVWSRY